MPFIDLPSPTTTQPTVQPDPVQPDATNLDQTQTDTVQIVSQPTVQSVAVSDQLPPLVDSSALATSNTLPQLDAAQPEQVNVVEVESTAPEPEVAESKPLPVPSSDTPSLPVINEQPAVPDQPIQNIQPVAEQPQPLAEQPVATEQPVVEQPVVEQPVVEQPVVAESPAPVTNETANPEIVVKSIDDYLLPAETGIEEIMKLAKEKRASDIHFASNYPIMIRVDGSLQKVTKPISSDQAQSIAESMLTPEQLEEYRKTKELDLSYQSKDLTRFRVNLFIERTKCAGALRLISEHIKTIEELELPQVLSDLITEPQGLILLVGPTGSGKSTTLAAMINQINLHRTEHIVTIEDPIEYIYPMGQSIVDQRELGMDTNSWDNALKSVLREDPDVVLVGEMRDLSTIESTIRVAETGHLVFSTLHTNSASQAIDRIIDVFPDGAKAQIRAQLANVITAVISQRLIPVQAGGRRAAVEVMLGSVAVRNAIREAKTYQIDNIIQTSGDMGMMTLEKSLVEMVRKNYITLDEAKANSIKPDEIEALYNK